MPVEPPRGPALGLCVLGTPVHLHWSFPGVGLGLAVPVALVCLAAAGPLALPVFLWAVVAVAALALVHELGHALTARALSMRVHGVYFDASGGCCVAEPAPSPRRELVYSAAGLGAQALVMAGSVVAMWHLEAPEQALLRLGAAVFTGVNLVLFVTNAWPRAGSDGQRIALALGRLRRRGPRAGRPRRAVPARARATPARPRPRCRGS